VADGNGAAIQVVATDLGAAADPVTIYRSGITVRGQGFESRVNEEATTVKGRVRAVVSPGALAGGPIVLQGPRP
jgi:hypothetical protein